MTPRLAALAAALVAIALPTLAWACPSCASRVDAGPAYTAILLGFIAVPFTVTGVIYRLIRSEVRAEAVRLEGEERAAADQQRRQAQ